MTNEDKMAQSGSFRVAAFEKNVTLTMCCAGRCGRVIEKTISPENFSDVIYLDDSNAIATCDKCSEVLRVLQAKENGRIYIQAFIDAMGRMQPDVGSTEESILSLRSAYHFELIDSDHLNSFLRRISELRTTAESV